MVTSTSPISAKGSVLPRMNSAGGDGRDHDLFHGADLLFADHGHAGQQQRTMLTTMTITPGT